MPRDGGDYEIVPFEERHREAVLRLRAEFMPVDPSWNDAHFRWQHEQSPAFDGHRIWLILFEGEPVGMRCLEVIELEVGSPARRFRAPTFVASYIRSDHRRGGLYNRITDVALTELSDAGFDWVVNLSPVPGTLVASLASGWRSIGPLESARREPSISGNRLHHRVQRNLVRAFRRFRRLGAGVESSVAPRPREMAPLARARSAAPGEHRIRRVHDEAFFAWRLRDPSSSYHFVYVERGGGLAGFAVLQRPAAPRGDRTLNLVDGEVREDLSWEELLGAVLDYADRVQEDLATWLGTFPPAARAALSELGFRPEPLPGPLARARPTILIWNLHDQDSASPWLLEGQSADDVRGWDIRMLDSDQF